MEGRWGGGGFYNSMFWGWIQVFGGWHLLFAISNWNKLGVLTCRLSGVMSSNSSFSLNFNMIVFSNVAVFVTQSSPSWRANENYHQSMIVIVNMIMIMIVITINLLYRHCDQIYLENLESRWGDSGCFPAKKCYLWNLWPSFSWSSPSSSWSPSSWRPEQIVKIEGGEKVVVALLWHPVELSKKTFHQDKLL